MTSHRLRVFTIVATGLYATVLVVLVRFPNGARLAWSNPRDLLGELRENTRWSPPAKIVVSTQQLTLAGIPNAGKVTATLYRGGQPTWEGYRTLREMGIQIVINFQEEENEIAAERRVVEAEGVRYVSIPWRASDQPDNNKVAEFLELVRANSDKKTFVHCEGGRDRTGVMVATFRMAMQNWRPQEALAEMELFGFRHDLFRFWHHHLETYVEEFPEQLSADSELRRVHSNVPPQ